MVTQVALTFVSARAKSALASRRFVWFFPEAFARKAITSCGSSRSGRARARSALRLVEPFTWSE